MNPALLQFVKPGGTSLCCLCSTMEAFPSHSIILLPPPLRCSQVQVGKWAQPFCFSPGCLRSHPLLSCQTPTWEGQGGCMKVTHKEEDFSAGRETSDF